MMMVEKAWGKVTEQICFRRSGILLEAQEGAVDDHDDLFKGIVDDVVDVSAVDELYLNQLCDARPDLAMENLDADRLVDFDSEIVTNKSQPLSVDEIVNEYLSQPAETV